MTRHNHQTAPTQFVEANGVRFWSSNHVQHGAYIEGGREGRFSFIKGNRRRWAIFDGTCC